MKKLLDHCLRIELSELLRILEMADIPVPPTPDHLGQGVTILAFPALEKGANIVAHAYLEIHWASEVNLTETS